MFLAIGIFVFHPVYINVCTSSQYGAPQKCEPHNILYVALFYVIETITSAGFWTAVATIAIAAFTWTLKQSTDKLWETSKRQIKLARDEFLSTHRPKIRVKHVWLM